jgi:hypothetical protein
MNSLAVKSSAFVLIVLPALYLSQSRARLATLIRLFRFENLGPQVHLERWRRVHCNAPGLWQQTVNVTLRPLNLLSASIVVVLQLRCQVSSQGQVGKAAAWGLNFHNTYTDRWWP